MRMPDLPDLNVEWPDAGHEAIRQAVVRAIAVQADHLEQLGDSFLLGQTAADFARTALAAVVSLQAAVTDQAAQIADLQTRVAALETPPPSPTPAA